MKLKKPLSLCQELLKLHAVKPGKLLGLDVGSSCIGLAVSDFNNQIASPLSVMHMHRGDYNINLMASEFQNLMSKHSISAFIVGYPYETHCVNQSASHVTGFLNALSKSRMLEDVLYTSWNKSFTTRHIKLLLDPYAFKPEEVKVISDKLRVVEILQGFLDFMNNEATGSKHR